MRLGHLPLLACGALLAAAGAASGAPLAEDHLTAGFDGPTDASLAAIYWNPAALGLLGLHPELESTSHLLVSGLARIDTGNIQRSPIDPATGLPGGSASRAFPPIDPFSVTPGGFAGIGGALGSWYLAAAVYTPFARDQHFGFGLTPASDGPARYHVLEQQEYDTYGTLAASYRAADELFFGVAFSTIGSYEHLVFDRDSALDGGSTVVGQTGYESDAEVQRIDVAGQGFSLGFSLGLLWKPADDLAVGAAYASRPLGLSGSNVQLGPGWLVGQQNATVIQPGCVTPSQCVLLRGTASFAYTLPDTFNLGVRKQIGERLDVALTTRLMSYGVLRTADLQLTSTPFREQNQACQAASPSTPCAPVPEHVARYRGLQLTVTSDLRVAYAASPSLRAGVGVVAQSSEVPQDNLNPAELDAPKLEPYVLAEWHPLPSLSLGALYAIGLALPRSPQPGVFDPEQQVACVGAHYDVDTCAGSRIGTAAPSAAGRYDLVIHTLALDAAYNF